MRRSAIAVAVLLAAPGVASAADRPTAAELEATQQIAQSALRKVALIEDSLDGKPPPDPAAAGRGGIVRATAAQMRTNQRIAQAAIRRAAAIEARLAGRPAPRVRPGDGDVIRLTAGQATITRRIALAAMRRASSLGKRVPHWHPAVEVELPGVVGVRSADLHAAGHAGVGMLVGERPSAAVRRGPLGRWTAGPLVSASGDRTVRFGPFVRVNARGAALAVWFTGQGEVVAARREPGGRWSAGAPVGLRGLSALALGEDGAAWAIGDGGKVRTQSSAGARWTAPWADVLVPGAIALDRTGRALAAWGVATDAPPQARLTQIFAAMLGPSGWGAPELVARTEAGTVAGEIAVGRNRAGDATVAWELHRAAPPAEGGLQAASRLAGGGWGAPVDLAPRGPVVADPFVAVDPDGSAVVAWRNRGFPPTAAAASRPPGAAFRPQRVLFAGVPDGSEQQVEATAHAPGDGPTVLLKLERHGGQVDWAVAEPGGGLLRVPDWDGGTQEAAAVAAGGGILVAGPDIHDQRALRVVSRGTD